MEDGSDNKAEEREAGCEPSSLDTVLLESLFYNEMMMMDSSHHAYSNFLEAVPAAAVQAEIASGVDNPDGGHHNQAAPTDSKDVAEKALLRDFGVSDEAVSQQQQQQQQVPPSQLVSAGLAPSAGGGHAPALDGGGQLGVGTAPGGDGMDAVMSSALTEDLAEATSQVAGVPSHHWAVAGATGNATATTSISTTNQVQYHHPNPAPPAPMMSSANSTMHHGQTPQIMPAASTSTSTSTSTNHIPIQPRPAQPQTTFVTQPSVAPAAHGTAETHLVHQVTPIIPSPSTADATHTGISHQVQVPVHHGAPVQSHAQQSFAPSGSHVAGLQNGMAAIPGAVPVAAAATTTTHQNPDKKAEQLVNQFATLASRLGIELPPETLRSLTTAAALNEQSKIETNSPGQPQQQQKQPPVQPLAPSSAKTGAAVQSPPLSSSTSTSSSVPVALLSSAPSIKALPTTYYAQTAGAPAAQGGAAAPASATATQQQNHHPTSSVPTVATPFASQPTTTKVIPTVEEMRKTAEAAIEAVSRKRELPSEFESSQSQQNSANKMVYSKRRKKPTLSDCESKLAKLKAENELLKRHLNHMSTKALRFDREKTLASERIKSYLEKDASTTEMKRGVQDFTDMYSDYGRRRQHELNFHLEQLQRLVNPTNFTKMGLWTLAQGSANPKHNPIAGMLQKELEITPQQGKKIIYQREQIRTVCENLKECLQLLAKLRSLCIQKTRIFHDRMKKCQEILTAKQVVKLIRWVNENTEVLDSVCPGWGAEQIRSRKAS